MDLTFSIKGRKFNKISNQLLRYQVLLVLEKSASTPRTAVAHNGTLKVLLCSRLTRLMR